MRQLTDEGFEYLRTRIRDRVHGVAHAVNESLLIKCLTTQQLDKVIRNRLLIRGIRHVFLHILEHLHDLVVRSAVLRAFQ